MDNNDYKLLPAAGDETPRQQLGAEQGCLTQVKRGIPILLILLLMSIVFLGVIVGVIAYGSGYYDYYLATKHYEKRDYKKTIESCSRSIDKNQKNGMSYLLRGTAYLDMGNREKAISDINRAVELQPNYAPSYVGRGICYIRMNKPDEAMKDFEKAINLNPEYGVAYYYKGLALLRLNRDDEALAEMNKAEKNNFKTPELYANRGGIYADKGEFKKGLEDINIAVEMEPENGRIYTQRGITHAKMGEFDKAMEDFGKSIQLEPDIEGTYRSRGSIYWRQGKLKEATEDIKKAVELRDHDIYLHIWKFILNERLGQDAKKEFSAFMRTHKDKDWPLPVADMLLETITPDECIKKAESENPRIDMEQKCEAYFYAAELYLIKGDKEKAKELFEKCISTDVTNFYEYDLAKSELKNMEE